MARRFQVPQMRILPLHCYKQTQAPALPVSRLSPPDIRHCWNNHGKHEVAAGKMVPGPYFAATNKDDISEIALANISVTLKTAWTLLQKIRSAMGERENIYYLGGSVEIDEAFLGGKAAGAAKTRQKSSLPSSWTVPTIPNS